jgi:hypothetical protein
MNLDTARLQRVENDHDRHNAAMLALSHWNAEDARRFVDAGDAESAGIMASWAAHWAYQMGRLAFDEAVRQERARRLELEIEAFQRETTR